MQYIDIVRMKTLRIRYIETSDLLVYWQNMAYFTLRAIFLTLVVCVLIFIVLLATIRKTQNLRPKPIHLKPSVGYVISNITWRFSPGEPISLPDLDLSVFQQFRYSSQWIIIAFSDRNYLDIAKLWYDQMSDIGYKNHYIACLDSSTYKSFQNIRYQSFPVIGGNKMRDKMSQIRKIRDKKRLIWKTRINTMEILLNHGLNVFLSDIDVVWLRYKDLEGLPKLMILFMVLHIIFLSILLRNGVLSFVDALEATDQMPVQRSYFVWYLTYVMITCVTTNW